MAKKQVVFVIMDGLGDRPSRELQSLTPLEAAATPVLDKMAASGVTGLAYPAGLGFTPGSDVGHLALFGCDWRRYYSGRGPIEAVGLGVSLSDGDVAFRANFASGHGDEILDRRAGRLQDSRPFAAALNEMNLGSVVVEVTSGTAHRGAVVLRGAGLSAAISDTDPHALGRVKRSAPLDDTPESRRTAELVNEFHEKAARVLSGLEINRQRIEAGEPPVNMILLRGPGKYSPVPSFSAQHKMSAACIAGGGLYKGVGYFLGMEVLEVAGATGRLDTDVNAKVRAAIECLDRGVDFVFVHFKGTDICGHDGDAVGKAKFIERVDAALAPLLDRLDSTAVVVTGDHSTPCSIMDHSGDGVPILLVTEGCRIDAATQFNERACGHGAFPVLEGSEIMELVKVISDRAPYVGA